MTRRRWCLSRVEIDDSSWRLSRISNSPYRDLPIESISFRLLRTCLQRNHLFHFFLKKNVVTTLPFHVIIDDQWQIDTHVDVWIVVYVSFSIFSTSWKSSESSRRIHPSMKRQHKWSLRLCYLDRKFVIISRAHPEVMTDNPNYSIAMIRYVKYLKWKTMSGKKKKKHYVRPAILTTVFRVRARSHYVYKNELFGHEIIVLLMILIWRAPVELVTRRYVVMTRRWEQLKIERQRRYWLPRWNNERHEQKWL